MQTDVNMTTSCNISYHEQLVIRSFSQQLTPLCLRPLTCAHLRTFFTVTAPGFAHRAAAHLLSEGGGQRVLTAPGLRHHQEALSLLSWRLWQRRQQGFIWDLAETDEGSKIFQMVRITLWKFHVIQVGFQWSLTHRHIDSFPAPNRACMNIWSCPVCSDSLRSDRHPAWSTHWYLQGQEAWYKNEKCYVVDTL